MKAFITHLLNFKNNLFPKKRLIVAILRIRNEELIISDTLDHLSNFCDGIVVIDDASTDKTLEIVRSHKNVIKIIRNKIWQPSIEERIKAETNQRSKALKEAMKFKPTWIFCADADERYIGNIKEFAQSDESKLIDGIRISLFDAYITEQDNKPYTNGKLLDFRNKFGPERRDILMMWRANSGAFYKGLDQREPILPSKNISTKFYCQHYGKSISIEQWEETCNYYTNHFPYESYGKKWEAR